MEGSGGSRVYEIEYTEPGVHRVQVNAFGKTIEGREFRLVLPEFTFNAESKESLLMPTIGADGEVMLANSENAVINQIKLAEEHARQLALELEEAKIAQELAAKEKEFQTYVIIGVANLGIVLFALIFYFISRRRKSK